MSSPRRTGTERTASLVASVAEEVFAAADGIQQDVLHVYHDSVGRSAPLSSADISQLGPTIRARLLRHADLLLGLGLITAPNLLGDPPLMLEWWQRQSGAAEPTALKVDLNPSSPGFYDYETAEWFEVPRRTRARHVVGPYVDVNGTGDYILTFTVPVMAGNTFVGVAGADVLATRFEERLMKGLAAGAGSLVVLNGDHRVVFSTSAHRLAGSRVPPDDADLDLTLTSLPSLPWRLGLSTA